MEKTRLLLLVDAIKRVMILQKEIEALKREAEELGPGVHLIEMEGETWSITVTPNTKQIDGKWTKFHDVSVKAAKKIV